MNFNDFRYFTNSNVIEIFNVGRALNPFAKIINYECVTVNCIAIEVMHVYAYKNCKPGEKHKCETLVAAIISRGSQ